jgi:predicted ATPase
MIERVTVGKALPKEVEDQIIDHTDGIPLFVEELTKTVLESGLLREQDDTTSLMVRYRRSRSRRRCTLR